MKNIALGLLFMAGFLGSLHAGETHAKKVLFIGMDGTRTDALLLADAPNLKTLRDGGAFFNNVQIFSPSYKKNDTCSGPGWSNLLTGVWPDKHGVQDNSFKGSNYTDYPHFFVRLKELQPKLFTASINGWEPIQTKIVAGADRNILTVVKDRPWPEVDKDSVKEAKTLLGTGNPDVLFVYIADVDETGHKNMFSPEHPLYMRAIHGADERVGELLEALKARPTYAAEDWLIVVATDHGGDGKGHNGGHGNDNICKVWCILNGATVTPGVFEQAAYQVDLVATIFAHMGLNPKPEWKLDGKPIGLKPAR